MRTLIVVEANPLCARVFRAVLGPLGCRVLLACSAAEAAEQARADAARRPAGEGAGPLLIVSTPGLVAASTEVARQARGGVLALRKPVAAAGLEMLVRRELGAVREKALATAAE